MDTIVTPLRHSMHEHAVQFYEDDEYLCTVVADVLATGMTRGEAALAIVTEEHRSRIVQLLAARQVDVEQASVRGMLTLLDARGTLGALLEDGVPVAARFEAVIGSVIDRTLQQSGAGVVCAYGEMVDVLWRDGKPDGALQLEVLWNALAETRPFRLLCAYAMNNFSSAADRDRFNEICRQHHHVVPTESYTRMSGAARLRRISELQQREKALLSELKYRRTLESRLLDALQERDELLQRERVARGEAEAANRAKSDFLAVMSHELRTPLNAIAGYAELLELGVPGPIEDSQRDMLLRIQQSQRHLLTLIDEVLTYTRAENVPREIVEDVRIMDVLCAAESSVLPQMRARSLAYTGAAADDTHFVRGDAGRLQQILTNLLANATKYTQPGGTVSVEWACTDGQVRLSVHDTGIGIAPDHLETIFEPFFQVDSRLTRNDQGLGLGLAISRRFARSMDGDLSVASRLGHGSTFTLTLPSACHPR